MHPNRHGMHMSEHKIDGLRREALGHQSSNPRKALKLLVSLVDRFEGSWLVTNPVVFDIVRIAKAQGCWDEAIFGCEQAQRLGPDWREA